MAREKLLSAYTTASAPARVTIYHHQLRDLLVCPRERGVVNYISSNHIVSHDLRKPYLPPKLLAQLDFQPNCLTSGCGLIVAGGSMAELFIGALPSSMDTTIPRHRSAKLPGPASINNSVLVTSHNLSPATLYGSSSPSTQPRLFVSNNDQTLKVFNVATADERPPHISPAGILKIPTPMNHASISPDGRTLLAVGDTNDVFLYNVSAGDSVSFDRISTYKAGTDANFSTAWSADGRKFATACQDGTVSVWDTRSSKALALFRCGRQTAHPTINPRRQQAAAGFGPVGRIRMSPFTRGFPAATPPLPGGPTGRRSFSREVIFALISEELSHNRLDDGQRQAVREFYRTAADFMDISELPPVVARLVEATQRRRTERARTNQAITRAAVGVEEDPYETPPSEGSSQVRARGIPRQYTWTTTVEGDVTVATRPSQSPTVSMPTSNWSFMTPVLPGPGSLAGTPPASSPSPELSIPPPAVYLPPSDVVRHWPPHFQTAITPVEPGRGEGSWMASASAVDPLPGSWSPDPQRNAARVLKFSPGTGSRDLLVWTEDASQFHVVDAQTFHDHVVVAVPSPPPPMTDVPESTVSSPAISTSSPTTSSAWTQPYQPNGQAALPSDVPHLTGLSFDPSGRWIYVGTSEGVYEWEAERGNWDRGYADFA